MTGFLATPSMQDVKPLEDAVRQLRVIVYGLLDPVVAARFREEWFGDGAI